MLQIRNVVCSIFFGELILKHLLAYHSSQILIFTTQWKSGFILQRIEPWGFQTQAQQTQKTAHERYGADNI